MSATPAERPRFTMRGVSKRFGATVALADVDLSVHPGRVHALIGENGAGKSTLMKILAGALRPDAGEMALDGVPFAPAGPLAARDAGIAMIYQELNLAPHLSVTDNVMLGMERRRGGFIRPAVQRREVTALLRRLNRPDIDCARPVYQLSPGERQVVEIARALAADARVVVMDEPTSSLGAADIEHLFDVIRELRSQGVAVVYISHFLEEVQEIADHYTVLRDGRAVGGGAIADTTIPALVELMIGRRLAALFPQVPHEPGEPLLTVSGMDGPRLAGPTGLTIRRGEILGLAGLVGAGRTEFVRTVFGLEPVRSGQVRIGRYRIARPSPGWSLWRGMGLLSEDPQREGLAVTRSIADNITLGGLRPFTRLGFVRLGRMRRAARRWMDDLGIRARHATQSVSDLSGGNQQKVAVARLLHHDVDILLLDEPTRGIDVASKAQIYELVGQLAARGKAVLFISSYMPELLGVCDQIAVMHRGRLAPPRPAAEWTEHGLIAAAAVGEGGA